MIRRLYTKILIYSFLGLGSIGLAVTFVMAKDEDPKALENKVESVKEVSAESKADSKGEKKSESRSDSKPKSGTCVASESAVEDIRHAQEEIEKKQKELATKEADLKNRENAISEELKKLTLERESIQHVQQDQLKETEEKKAKLIETLLAMSPKAAAKVFSTIDNSLAVSVMSQMDTPRLAKIMNLIEAKRSTQLSELLVGLARAKDVSAPMAERSVSSDAAVANEKLKKGGDK